MNALMPYILGGLSLGIPIILIVSRLFIEKNGVEIDAEIVDVQTKRVRTQYGSNDTYHAVLRYVVDGKEYTFVNPGGFDTTTIGETMKLIYYRKNPARVVVKKGAAGKILSLIGCLIFMAIGVLCIWSAIAV
ncbi:MAG: DUF3592 domain-containing protein [Defluviitaleaceae bacterium]|nr:DUF3592 domain-containing protein [Defluviitaleaceae bacterium]